MNNKIQHKLSVIIPCYNCEQTLEEAVKSVYRQNLDLPYEIILVDDKSTDGTRELMSLLKQKYPQINCFFHDQNLGGGATRNTAVEKTTGDIIFCLDSDDLLGDGTLSKMVKLLIEKNCDGVGISTSIKFRGRNKKDIAFTNNFGFVGEKIPFDSLIEKTGQPLCSLYSTFMFTKKAFQITGGYPTNHGFDTQGFAWRFLARGLIAYTCPEAVYWHRIAFHKSYYLREYESGKISHNWNKIVLEFFFLFSDEVKNKILDFNLNDPNLTLMDWLKKQDNVFVSDYQKEIRPKNAEEKEEKTLNSNISNSFDYFWLGNKYYQEKKYREAIDQLIKAVKEGLGAIPVYKILIDSLFRLNNLDTKTSLDRILKTEETIKQGSLSPIYLRIIRKIRKIIKK